MTEAEWFASSESLDVLRAVREKVSIRKQWLFGCACCRQIWDLLQDFTIGRDVRSLQSLEAGEEYADGKITETEWEKAIEAAVAASEGMKSFLGSYEEWAAEACVHAVKGESWHAARRAVDLSAWCNSAEPAEEDYRIAASKQVPLLRDIFGNPFRPAAFSPSWRTDTAVSLARTMYDSREFSAMPILADALQDAGCDSDDILSHCRDPKQVHVRGCWVTDLVLNKS